MQAISSSVKKYFLNFFVLEARREKRNPGPFTTQAIPITNQKTNKKNVKERLVNKELIITFEMTFGPRIK